MTPRAQLAAWQAAGRHDLRERWGREANALEASGVPLEAAERIAMERVLAGGADAVAGRLDAVATTVASTPAPRRRRAGGVTLWEG